MTPAKALDIRYFSQDIGKVVSIREYLKTLLLTLWDEGESFSGKRPLGNSGWEHELVAPLIYAGCIKGTLRCYNDDDEPIDYDPLAENIDTDAEAAKGVAYDAFVTLMIEAL